MPLRHLVAELPIELVRKRPVIVLFNLRLQLLHPPDLLEQIREVSVHLLPDSPLYTVPESAIAVLPPEGVDLPEVGVRDELDLREEHVPALLCVVSGEGDEQPAGLLVRLPEVLGGEVALQDVVGHGGLRRGGGRRDCSRRSGGGKVEVENAARKGGGGDGSGGSGGGFEEGGGVRQGMAP
ncbi:unnamed protein product [Cuscuta epithymum]|uniref:Uncharacterized protein n=1 Tax=Cuscuta epithymum TaxID=186058 RepID=A0AAV0F7D5_9ASTE|nr:unnamed protein product [Cuscuta epithymum]